MRLLPRLMIAAFVVTTCAVAPVPIPSSRAEAALVLAPDCVKRGHATLYSDFMLYPVRNMCSSSKRVLIRDREGFTSPCETVAAGTYKVLAIRYQIVFSGRVYLC
jgi:hypothetical protein